MLYFIDLFVEENPRILITQCSSSFVVFGLLFLLLFGGHDKEMMSQLEKMEEIRRRQRIIFTFKINNFRHQQDKYSLDFY